MIMKKLKYSQDDINTDEQHSANSIIMEIACDMAQALTEEECKESDIEVYLIENEGEEDEESSYTEEAQDIFNEHYDQKMDEVYAVANIIEGKLTYDKLLKAIKK
jgi:hypothetical protein